MPILIDIGNTRLKWAITQGDQLEQQGAVNTQDVLHGAGAPTAVVESMSGTADVWVSSVAAVEVVRQIRRCWFGNIRGDRFHVVKVSERVLNIKNGYQNLEQLGVDRWVAAIGARYLFAHGDLIVVDAGTAVTIDWLDSYNCFQGGAILPGPHLMHDALVGRTAGIKSEFSDTQQIVGKTTSECVNSGVSYGLVGAIEHVVGEMQTTINKPVRVVLTGGAAKQIKQKLKAEADLEELLVLYGLLALSEGG